MVFDVRPTVNPLVYIVRVSWTERVPGNITLQVWNLLQKWLVKNDCSPNGNVDTQSTSIAVQVAIKRRLGNPKDESP